MLTIFFAFYHQVWDISLDNCVVLNSTGEGHLIHISASQYSGGPGENVPAIEENAKHPPNAFFESFWALWKRLLRFVWACSIVFKKLSTEDKCRARPSKTNQLLVQQYPSNPFM